ncbi:plasmid mobilization protein [uncultured Desulfuromonas sp.]|uniref:plasmid mobilization protein n=1 Tax=uncultured Desulfuromonas sp. TaxID=181013 RepID=UPI002AAB9794|nr:hypothetical protein [uncultured Desulfuromonas sp.]
MKHAGEHVISFRVTAEERAYLRAQARQGGVTVSRLVRQHLRLLKTTQSVWDD